MITITSTQMHAWIAGLLWPLTRILGLFMVAPLFSNRSIPARVRIVLGVLIALIVAPAVSGSLPPVDPMSAAGLVLLAQQMVIGLAMGFAMRIVFAAVEMAGEMVGLTMGLGFATFFDPQSHGRSSAISQFLALLVLMIYLAANVHLVLLSVLVESFATLPIGAPADGGLAHQLVQSGSRIFSLGVQLALPMVAALLMTNMALGILTRAAPQLNLFGIGFPLTLTVGFVLIGLALPYLATPMERLLQEGVELARRIAMLPTP
jgi:flagellar biosynthetic protein FliR